MFTITKFVHERYRASDWETRLAPFICAKRDPPATNIPEIQQPIIPRSPVKSIYIKI
jgi:hypothetical protein